MKKKAIAKTEGVPATKGVKLLFNWLTTRAPESIPRRKRKMVVRLFATHVRVMSEWVFD